MDRRLLFVVWAEITRVVFKDMCGSAVVTTMGEYLLPYIRVVDLWQRRKIDIIGPKVRS